MESGKELQTIIQNSAAYTDHPWFVLSDELVHEFKTCASEMDHRMSHVTNRLLHCLDCFLHICGAEHFGMGELSKLEVLQWTTERFIGALYSPSFILVSSPSRYKYAEVFRTLLLRLSDRFQIPIWDPACPPPIPSDKLHLPLSQPRVGLPQFTQECISKYEAMSPLNEKAIYLWNGWPSTNMDGKTAWLRLYPIYVRLGKEFTERLYEQCDRYYSSRRASRVPALTSLGKFIAQYPGDLKESDFKSPAFMTRFWPEFLIFFITTGDEEGTSLSVMCGTWRAEFIFFVKEFLIEGGVCRDACPSWGGKKRRTLAGRSAAHQPL